GSDFGRHYGAANKQMKRLSSLIMALDLNVVVTAHAKKEYAPGAAMQLLGQTFDGWKALDYLFDLVMDLSKKGKKRFGRVVKSRIETFPDEDVFEWSYDAIKKRYEAFAGEGILDRASVPVELATPEQVKTLKQLLEVVRLPDDTTAKWLAKANVDTFEDMPAATIDKCVQYVRDRLPDGKMRIEPAEAVA
ncbi:MAG TPA: hypothetical protein VEA69_16955, partial [Tepidisphaeraceae bacterium]|nr:hypothetical protein [Tepidisphaeraceae bacterium]